MMKIRTTALPLTFWAQLQARVVDEIAQQHSRVKAALSPVLVPVDGKGHSDRLIEAQDKFQQGITRLESLRLLALAMTTQVEAARFDIGVHGFVARIQFFEALHAFYADVSSNRPSRVEAEQALNQLQTAYTSACRPNGGEWAASERGRLLAQTVAIPVLSAEDAPNFAAAAHRMQNDLLRLRAQLDTLLATTMVAMEVSPALAELLQELGVTMLSPEEPPQQPLADSAADA